MSEIRDSEHRSQQDERQAYGRAERAAAQIEEHSGALARQSEVRDAALQRLARFAATKLLALAAKELADVEPWPWAPTRGVEIAREAEQSLSTVEADDAPGSATTARSSGRCRA